MSRSRQSRSTDPLDYQHVPRAVAAMPKDFAAGFVIVLETPVRGNVDMWSAQPVSKEEAVQLLNVALNKSGYSVTQRGRSLVVSSKEDAKKRNLPIRTGNDPAGKHVVICGRSNLVGKPLAALLVQKAPGANATVTVCHTGTRDLAKYTRQADIVVAATGVRNSITADMVADGAVVIDVGMNRDDEGRLCGDVDFEGARAVAGWLTPVPGGVGPMTIAMLLVNTVEAAERLG